MRKIEYYCDFCGDVIRKERTGPDVKDFVAFEFGPCYKTGKPFDRFVVKDAHSVERHLCLDCLRGLSCLARTVISIDKEGWPD